MTPPFVPGVELARLFYAEVVRPLLDQAFPDLPHSAGLLGPGSEVLGFDTPRSTDHNWGPRLQVLVSDADSGGRAAEIDAMLTDRLPAWFRGYPTVFPASGAPEASARHWVEVRGLGQWLTGTLGFDPRGGITMGDWLATPTQRLAEVTCGAVFHDGLAGAGPPGALGAGPAGTSGGGPAGTSGGGPAGTSGGGSPGALGAARAALRWYPRDVWRYVLACQWQRIGEEEAFPGRCTEAGDDLGSAVVTARLVRDLMRLTLLMHQRYPPYSKWLGTAFARLPAAAPLIPLLAAAISSTAWPERERNLCAAYRAAAALHNDLGVGEPVDVGTMQYYDRPYQVLDAGRLVAALQRAIADPEIRQLAPIGAVDQFVDSTDALGNVRLLRAAVTAELADLTALRG
jgi:hypothetical protein